MRRTMSAIAVALLMPCGIWAQVPTVPADQKKAEMPSDMQRYVFGLLKKGPAWTSGATEETKKIQEGHMANIERLATEGKLILAGPFEGGEDLRGIFVFKVGTLEDARALVETDPAVKAGRLKVDLVYWWGPKSLTKVLEDWEASKKK